MAVQVDWTLSVAGLKEGAGSQLLGTKNSPCPAEGILISNPTAAQIMVGLYADQAPQTDTLTETQRTLQVGPRTMIALPVLSFVGIAVFGQLATPPNENDFVLIEALDTVTPAAGRFTASDAAALQDASGTVATAGTSQQVLAAGTATRYLLVENVAGATSGTVLWVNFGGAASEGPGSVALGPGQALEYTTVVPNQALNVTSSTATAPFTVKYA